MGFFTIHSPRDLSAVKRARLDELGLFTIGENGEAPPEQLRRVGFVDVQEHELTAEYRETLFGLLVHEESLSEQLRRHEGVEAFDERLARRKAKLAAMEDGLLRRSLFVARAPASS